MAHKPEADWQQTTPSLSLLMAQRTGSFRPVQPNA
jgi:hypothetical protein